MNTVLTLLLCLGIAMVVVGAMSKPKTSRWDGFLVKGKDGRIGITLNPIKKRKKRKARRSR